MADYLERVKWFTIWTRTIAINLLAISYSYLSGPTLFSILGLAVGGLKLLETILFELSTPLEKPTRTRETELWDKLEIEHCK